MKTTKGQNSKSLRRKKEVRTSHNKKQKISKNKNRIYNTIRGKKIKCVNY